MPPETISAVLTGLAGLITAVSGFYALRKKRDEDDVTANYRELLSLRKENARYRRIQVLMLRWVQRIEVKGARSGFLLPKMPDELDRLLNDAPESGPFPAQRRRNRDDDT